MDAFTKWPDTAVCPDKEAKRVSISLCMSCHDLVHVKLCLVSTLCTLPVRAIRKGHIGPLQIPKC